MIWIITKVQLYCEKNFKKVTGIASFLCAEEACLSMVGMSVEMLYL